jgi:hypothetical protein
VVLTWQLMNAGMDRVDHLSCYVSIRVKGIGIDDRERNWQQLGRWEAV